MESGLFSGADHLEDGGLTSQSPSSGKVGDSRLKTHLCLLVQAEAFIRREGVEKFSTCRPAQSFPVRQVVVSCASPRLQLTVDSRHCGSTSS